MADEPLVLEHTIEAEVSLAFRFEWHLRAVSERRTTLTQRIILFGSNAATYRQQVETGFGTSLGAGMERIAASMVAAGHAAGTDAG